VNAKTGEQTQAKSKFLQYDSIGDIIAPDFSVVKP